MYIFVYGCRYKYVCVCVCVYSRDAHFRAKWPVITYIFINKYDRCTSKYRCMYMQTYVCACLTMCVCVCVCVCV